MARIGGVSWSPDSTRIAYTTTTGGQTELLVVSLASGTPVSLLKSTEAIGAPAWTPDGANLVYPSAAAVAARFSIQSHRRRLGRS